MDKKVLNLSFSSTTSNLVKSITNPFSKIVTDTLKHGIFMNSKKFLSKSFYHNNPKHKKKQWIKNFHVMYSKDNDFLPRGIREFFDKPLKFNSNASKFTIYRLKDSDTHKSKKNLIKTNTNFSLIEPISNISVAKLKPNKRRIIHSSLSCTKLLKKKELANLKKKESKWNSKLCKISEMNVLKYKNCRVFFDNIIKKNKF